MFVFFFFFFLYIYIYGLIRAKSEFVFLMRNEFYYILRPLRCVYLMQVLFIFLCSKL